MRSIGALLLVSLSALAASAQTNSFEWKGDLQPGQTLEIRNINGSIRAEAAEGSQVEIAARITGTRPAPGSVRIHIEPHAGGVVACTIYDGLSVPDYCTPEMTPSVQLGNSDIKVHYVVRVPAGVALHAKTVNGGIRAGLPQSAIRAETVNGRVSISTAQAASANVVNGTIVASLDAWEGTAARTFRAVNGTIDIELPATTAATVHASTLFGPITNDFRLPVRRWIVGTHMDGDINGGGAPLTMETANGGIHLRQSDRQ